VRVSGPQAHALTAACFEPARSGARGNGQTFPQAVLRRGWLRDPRDGARIDEALIAHFHAPRSYTGEDVAELHLHGGPGVVAACLRVLIDAGARLAQPGEFTKRAFLNGRLDLAQAEAVADLIAAESERAARAAAVRLAGALSDDLTRLRRELLDRLVEIEAHVDYPDEVPEPDVAALAAGLRAQAATVEELLAGARGARALREGISCVIAGPPNAGKSSLLNALVASDRAIVSAIPGTTRDVIEDRIVVDGVIVRLSDTAGLREPADVLEAEGVARTRRALAGADLVVLVVDASVPPGADEREAFVQTAGRPRIVLCNKGDLRDAGAQDMRRLAGDGDVVIAGSVRWPQTVESIRAEIARLGWGGQIDTNRALVANARHVQALTRAREALARALQTLDEGHPMDVVSSDLREAAAAYGEVTGDQVTEEVLDGIFSRFCVGK
jgi:tRNA modification GTPase